MGWIIPAAIGTGAAIAGIGLATQTKKFAEAHTAKVGEKYWDAQIEGRDRSATDYYGGSVVYEFMGGIGLAVGGVSLLARGGSLTSKALGGAALLASGALLGYGVGAAKGFSAGERAAHESHGVDIDKQVVRLMKNFDHDKNGTLATTDDQFPEYLYKYEFQVPREGSPVQTKYASIEKFLNAADANKDSKATRTEVAEKLHSYDKNGDGLMSIYDARGLTDDGLEHVAVEERLIEYDPYGAYIPVEW